MSHKAKSVYNNGIFFLNKLIPAHLGTVKITNYIMKKQPILSYLQAGEYYFPEFKPIHSARTGADYSKADPQECYHLQVIIQL